MPDLLNSVFFLFDCFACGVKMLAHFFGQVPNALMHAGGFFREERAWGARLGGRGLVVGGWAGV
ncbi:hypothetical protein DOM21_19070 [Bacteriovorax stolpii]|nr:hypothetical protein DOM21_19070 [Bacteriovorax stolpii]